MAIRYLVLLLSGAGQGIKISIRLRFVYVPFVIFFQSFVVSVTTNLFIQKNSNPLLKSILLTYFFLNYIRFEGNHSQIQLSYNNFDVI